MIKSKHLCIYHANCADGFAAAAVVKLGAEIPFRNQSETLVEKDVNHFMAANYGDPAPDVTGKIVYMVDFSYPREALLKMHEQAEKLVVIDHHQSAREALEGLDFCHFDMSKCGAVLTWEYFFPDKEVPLFLQYIQDRDLWQWKLECSKEFSAGLQLEPKNLVMWSIYIENHNENQEVDDFIFLGSSVLRYQELQIEKQAKRAFTSRIAGYDVPTINCTHLVSEIGNELCKGHPFAALYFDLEDKRVYSLRSDENGVDVSKIAGQFEGGGGHKHAAGFSVPKPTK